MNSNPTFWVYAIKSKSAGRIYIGQTKDMGKKLQKHNLGGVYSTKTDRPWELIAYQSFASRAKAISKESELKRSRGKRSKWIEMNRKSI